MASLLCGSVSPTYSNLSSVAHHRSSWQASKDGRFEDAFNIENALMQQPSHIHTCVQKSSLMTGFRISRIFKPSLLQWGEVSEFLGDASCLNVFEGHCSQTMVTCLDYWPLDKSKVWPLDTLLFVYSGKILSCQLYLCPLPGKYNIKQTFLSMSVLGIIPCWADQFSSPHE